MVVTCPLSAPFQCTGASSFPSVLVCQIFLRRFFFFPLLHFLHFCAVHLAESTVRHAPRGIAPTSSPAADHHDGRCTASYCIVSNAFVPQHSMYIQARAFENTSFLMTPQATAHAAALPPCRTISMRGEMPDWWAHFRLWGAWHIPGKAPRPPKKNAGIPARPWPWDAGSAVAWPGGAAPVERVTKHATAAWRVASLGGMLPQQIGGRSSRQGGARKAVARSMSTT